jgi:hypothetical protein
MLHGLGPEVFAGLEDAYGPAVDIADRLRALVTSDGDRALDALSDLYARIFHQDNYFSSTAPAVPFLIQAASLEGPLRAEILLFLGRMAAAPVDPELAYRPHFFRSSPRSPRSPEALATFAAISSGHDAYVAALEAASPQVRACAAYVLRSSPDGPNRTAAIRSLERALAREEDDWARVAMVFALAGLGGRVPSIEGGLASCVATVLRARGPIGSAEQDSLRRLLVSPRAGVEAMPFFDSELTTFAAHVLSTDGGTDPRAFEVLSAALNERIDRGERVVESRPPSWLVCDQEESSVADEVDPFADTPLLAIASAMAAIAFADRPQDPRLLRREDLDDRMRRTLALTRDHGIAVPVAGAPWCSRDAMARFLRGGGPLDLVIDLGGENAPLFAHLRSLARPNEDDAEATPRLEALFADLAARLSETDWIDLAVDILEGSYEIASYGNVPSRLQTMLERHVEPFASRHPAKLGVYADALRARGEVTGPQARFALLAFIQARAPVDVRDDRLVASALGLLGEQARDWLASFPEPRRSAIVAWPGGARLLKRLRSVCDAAILEDQLIARFTAADCAWSFSDAESLLAIVSDTARLRALRDSVSGRRRVLVGRVLRARTRDGVFTLEMHAGDGGVRAVLRDGAGALVLERTLSAQPFASELVPFAEACAAYDEPCIELAGDVDRTTEYRVQRTLFDAGFRGRVTHRHGYTESRV